MCEREERWRECWQQKGGELRSQREDGDAVHDVSDGAEGAHHTVEFGETRMKGRNEMHSVKHCTKDAGDDQTGWASGAVMILRERERAGIRKERLDECVDVLKPRLLALEGYDDLD